MLFSDINPFIVDVSSDEVRSSVLNFTVDNCDRAPPAGSLPSAAAVGTESSDNATDVTGLRKRRDLGTSDVGEDNKMQMSLNLPRKEPVYVNGSTIDVYKMLYHTINITEPVEPMIVVVYPMANESLTVYVRIGYLPSPDNYSWAMNVSGSVNSSFERDNNTIFIPAEDMTNITMGNETVNIGVQRTGKFVCIHFVIHYGS